MIASLRAGMDQDGIYRHAEDHSDGVLVTSTSEDHPFRGFVENSSKKRWQKWTRIREHSTLRRGQFSKKFILFQGSNFSLVNSKIALELEKK